MIQSMFPDIWQKSRICPIHKKGDKQTINNYMPVSLLPICGKLFQRVIFNSLYKYVEETNYLSGHQSGFWSNDSFVNQLLWVVCSLYKAFVLTLLLKLCCMFLDMSKVFDKVWYQGRMFKLKSVGVSDSLLKSHWKFNRHQWLLVKVGVSQDPILGLIFSLIYINDLCDDLLSTVKLLADNISLFSVVYDSNISATIFKNIWTGL